MGGGYWAACESLILVLTKSRQLIEERKKETRTAAAGQETSLPFNEVDTRRRLDHVADLARLQGKSGIFKLLLHVTLSEKTPAQGVNAKSPKRGMVGQERS